MNGKKLTILRCAPRGFCAGVERAILIVEKAIEKYGAPVYVRHEIVHNKNVVDSLRDKGAVFVKNLDEVPDDVPVIFSAHGVAKAVPQKAEARGLFYIDATCPLVSKVHREAVRWYEKGKKVILIGHRGHPEVLGTMGQLPSGAVILVEVLADIEALPDMNGEELAFVTQTTLSVDDTAELTRALKLRFEGISSPKKKDICYATTNRQAAVKAIADRCDAFVIIGAANSSNTNRLCEVAAREGCPMALRLENAGGIDWDRFENVKILGLTAGASAPEALIEGVIIAAKEHFDVVVVEDVETIKEDITFPLPFVLRDEVVV